jgi:hypothetical protein
MFNRPNSSTLIVGGIVVVVTLLSVGLLYGAKWAGGDGIVSQLEIHAVGGGKYEQNEVIETDDEYLTLQLSSKKFGIPEATVFLDRYTSVQFTNTDYEHLQIRVIEGRVSMDSHTVRPITVTTGDLTVQTADIAHMVFYGWLHKLEIAIPEGTGTITSARGDYQKTLQNEALYVTVLDRSTVEGPLTFDPAASVAAEFYKRTKLLEF